MNLGMTELLLLAGIALLFFGPSRLPGLGRSVGQAIRGFKKGISEDPSDEENGLQKTSQLSHEARASVEENKKRETEKNRSS